MEYRVTRFHQFVEDTPARMINGKGQPVDLRRVDALLQQARKSARGDYSA